MLWRIDTPDQAKVVYTAILGRLERDNYPLDVSVKRHRKPKTPPSIFTVFVY